MVVETALHCDASHAEGPVWDAASGALWWVNIIGERVHRFDPEAQDDSSWPTGGQPGGVVIDAAGVAVVAAPDGLRALDQATGALELIVAIEPEKPENRCNDAKVDGHGRLWVGTMAYDKRPANAGLHRITTDGPVVVVAGLTISNGPAHDERAGRMYLADTAIGRVDVFDYDAARGEIGDRRPFLDVSAEGFWPDGMTVNDDGCLWLALGRAGAVHRYRPDGTLDGVVEIPTSNPTSVAFGGADGGDLYITSSRHDLAEELRPDQPLAGAVFRCRPGVTGPAGPRWSSRP